MFKRIMSLFGEQVTTDPFVYSDSSYLVYQLPDGLRFGLKAVSLSNREIELLGLLADRVVLTTSPRIAAWKSKLDHESCIEENGHRMTHLNFTGLDFTSTDDVSDVLASFFPDESVVVPMSDSRFTVIEQDIAHLIPFEDIEEMISALKTDFYMEAKVLVGQAVHRGDIAKRYRLEQHALDCLRDGETTSHLTAYTRLAVQSDTARDELTSLYLSSLDEEAKRMLHVFFRANLNASLTAKQLFLHRNSLQYRLDRLIEQTGIDVRTFEGAAFLHLLLSA
ncbi:PucR family transcriptional regulator [Exiguobacterium flavidum]|uniref:PucR family transcriptional regulator n=1 Tax=Exiguobacterium flavidum TaxID=2184695 RepID=UPI00130062B0|nr:helix-turn-helix domain-containing protein [Exiguobacterium flavidum]